MQTKRRLLELLSRAELVDLVDRFAVAVDDRRVKEQLVDAVARSQRASLAEALPALPRERLKELCTAVGLDDTGREKAVLVDRLLGRDGAAAERAASRAAPAAPSAAPAPSTLTVEQLERHLWSAADILRGSIDSSDYKNFIFGLLFLKRLSDRFEEEARRLIADGLPEDVAWSDPDEHQFFVPPKARWSAIQRTATNIGEALNKACALLEEHNASLAGVLGGIDYNDERKLGDAKNRDTVLARLVQHFSRLALRNADLAEPDMLGRAYEYLIERFADDAGKKGGEFYTPRQVVQLIVKILAPRPGMKICDPTVGSGGMLIECAHYVERHGGNVQDLALHGQEKNLGTWAICKMNMLLHGLADHRIEKGDTIRDPKLVEDGQLLLYDRVIANPPFSLDEWGREVAENDRYGRFRFGIPPKTKGDLAFVQHMLAVLNPRGQLGVVMPHGVLFRGAAEGAIRKGLLQEDLFEAVIGLAPNLFYGAGIPAAILVINRAKPPDRRRKVLFIHAAEEMVHGGNQNTLSDSNVQRIAKAFHAFADEARFSRVVTEEEIARNDWNLNIARYVDLGTEPTKSDIRAELKRLKDLREERDAAETRMADLLRQLGYGEV